MIIIMKPNASEEAIEKVKHLIESKGLQAHLSKGDEVTIVGVVGDKTRLHDSNIEISEGVDKIVNVTESYKLVNKKFHPGRLRDHCRQHHHRAWHFHGYGRSMCH